MIIENTDIIWKILYVVSALLLYVLGITIGRISKTGHQGTDKPKKEMKHGWYDASNPMNGGTPRW